MDAAVQPHPAPLPRLGGTYLVQHPRGVMDGPRPQAGSEIGGAAVYAPPVSVCEALCIRAILSARPYAGFATL